MGLGVAKHEHVKLKAPTAQEQAITQNAVNLAELQNQYVQRQKNLSEFLASAAPGYFSAAERALDPEAFQNMINQARSDIGASSDEALRLGEADINRQTEQGILNLRDTLAPERGLRPGDSPILGLGSDITREGLFNQGQLVRAIRGKQSELYAGLPQLQSQLATQAFQNRLQLATGASQVGIGLNPNYDVNAALGEIQKPRLTAVTGTSKEGGWQGAGSSGGSIIGAVIGACWVAAEFYGWHTPEWFNARRWLLERWRGPIAWAFRRIYLRHGERIARIVHRNRIVREVLRPIFAWAERRGR